MIYEVTKNSLSLDLSGFTLVDFYADWCGPCKVLSNNLQEFEKIYPNINIKKVNVDENDELVEKYKIRNVPSIICFKQGIEYWRHSGLMTLDQLREKFIEL
jgi:thioredoxin 1